MLTTAPVLGGLLLLSSLSSTLSRHLEAVGSDQHHHQRLAVLFPMPQSGWHDGQWPTGCSSGEATTQKVDLVLYVSRQKGLAGAGAQPPHLPHNHCFARVHAVYGPEVNSGNPNSPSTDMLYSAFLDKGVHSQLSQYGALAAIPSWDDASTAAANDFSAAALYGLAFPQHSLGDEFWVKTLTLGGADPKNLRGGDGRGSGGGEASIYNNDDSEFVDFVRATHELQRSFQQQWGASAPRSFDAALSFALKDPRYKESAPMFVAAGVIPTRGGVDEEHAHASATRTRKLQQWRETQKWKTIEKYKTLRKWQEEEKWRTTEKYKTKFCDEDGCPTTKKDGTGRVCDASCEFGELFGKNGCSASNGKFGMFCRVCYNDIGKAQLNDSPDDRAIMCDTMEPVSVYSRRNLFPAYEEDYIPEEMITTRRLQHAEQQQQLQHRREDEQPASANGTEKRKLQKWREEKKWKDGSDSDSDASDDVAEPKWKTQQKWKGDPENGVPPKWQVEEKWKTKFCDPECTRTSNDGTKGRVCDSSCEYGEPYGKKGCSAKNGKFGMFCRVCYNDLAKAQRNDSPDDRAIMCDTMEPPSVYSKRGLAAEETPDHRSGRATSELASRLSAFNQED